MASLFLIQGFFLNMLDIVFFILFSAFIFFLIESGIIYIKKRMTYRRLNSAFIGEKLVIIDTIFAIYKNPKKALRKYAFLVSNENRTILQKETEERIFFSMGFKEDIKPFFDKIERDFIRSRRLLKRIEYREAKNEDSKDRNQNTSGDQENS